MMTNIDRIKRFGEQATEWVEAHVANVGAGAFGWLAVIFLHSATIPALLAIMAGLSDNMLPVEMVLLMWLGLAMMFLQAVVQHNFLQIITISVGFMLQAVLMALIFFR
jgi:hypothetical protein